MRTGRPRSFCKDEALDRAMTVYWRQGYEGASMADLTKAIGINPPSLYACFGSKEGLFKAVLERYDLRRATIHGQCAGSAVSGRGGGGLSDGRRGLCRLIPAAAIRPAA